MADTTGTPTYGAAMPLPLPKEGYGSFEYFKELIDSAQEKLDAYKTEWDRNVQSYLTKTLDKVPDNDRVIVPLDFANVESKKAGLFFQTPDVQLTAQQPGLEDAVGIFQAALNHQLGPDGVDAIGMMREVLFDALCPSGLMVSKIGYESYEDGTVDVPTGEMQPDPEALPQPGSVLGLGPEPPMVPVTQPVPNIIHQNFYWRRVSGAKAIIPADFRGGNYDRAPVLGFEFEMDLEVAKRTYGLDDELSIKTHTDDERVIKSEKTSSAKAAEKVKGWELWYYAYCFDPAVKHPQQMRLLVILEGIDEPVRHEDSPFQKWVDDPAKPGVKKLTGMMGHPIHIGALRYVSDTAYPPSETSVSRSQVEEMNKSRSQMIWQRDRNVPMRVADLARIGGEEGLEKIRKGIWQGIVPLPTASQNDPPIFSVGEAHFPPENFQFHSVIMQDVQRIWGMGANQQGLETEEKKTATEINSISRNSDARMDAERRVVLDYYIRGVRKLASLLQLFADETQYVEMVGPTGAKRLQPWNKDAIQGQFAFTAKPNSAIHVDAAEDLNNALKAYELLAKDPHVNRVELLMQIARKGNFDAQRLIVQQLPPKPPDPPNVSFRFSGEDINPTNPNFPIVVAIMQQAGYQLPPEAIQEAQQHAADQAHIMNAVAAGAVGPAPTPGAGVPAAASVAPTPMTAHGGPAPKMSRLSKRRAEEGGHGEQ